MTTYRISPLAVICPFCSAGVDEPCRVTHLGDKGTGKHRSSPHQQRLDAADVSNVPNTKAREIGELRRLIDDLRYQLERAKPNSIAARENPAMIEEVKARLRELGVSDP